MPHSNPNLSPVQVVDKNGKLTTVYKGSNVVAGEVRLLVNAVAYPTVDNAPFWSINVSDLPQGETVIHLEDKIFRDVTLSKNGESVSLRCELLIENPFAHAGVYSVDGEYMVGVAKDYLKDKYGVTKIADTEDGDFLVSYMTSEFVHDVAVITEDDVFDSLYSTKAPELYVDSSGGYLANDIRRFERDRYSKESEDYFD